MLLFMGLQRIRHDWVTEQQCQWILTLTHHVWLESTIFTLNSSFSQFHSCTMISGAIWLKLMAFQKVFLLPASVLGTTIPLHTQSKMLSFVYPTPFLHRRRMSPIPPCHLPSLYPQWLPRFSYFKIKIFDWFSKRHPGEWCNQTWSMLSLMAVPCMHTHVLIPTHSVTLSRGWSLAHNHASSLLCCSLTFHILPFKIQLKTLSLHRNFHEHLSPAWPIFPLNPRAFSDNYCFMDVILFSPIRLGGSGSPSPVSFIRLITEHTADVGCPINTSDY